MSEPTFSGGCFCRRVRYEVTGRVRNLCFCHCVSCRRAAGSPMVAWGTFELDKLRITGGKLAEYASSPKVTRGFCSACGTSITYFHEGRPNEIDITLVTLDDPTALVPEFHIWVQDKLPWVRIEDG